MKRRDLFLTMAGAGAAAATGVTVVVATKPETVTKPTLKLSGGPLGHSCKVELDGQDISRFTRRVSFEADARSPIEAHIEVYAKHGFQFAITPRRVMLQPIVMPGYVLIEETRPDGSRAWHTEPEPTRRPGWDCPAGVDGLDAGKADADG